jgi:hypothetical protein
MVQTVILKDVSEINLIEQEESKEKRGIIGFNR